MAILAWTEELSVGVPLLDGHHKRLFELLADLYNAIQAGGSSEVVGRVLGELAEYTQYHFTEEERLLEQAGYPDLAAHHKAHKALTDQVGALYNDYLLDPRTVYAAELFQFLSGWLVNHIKIEDFSYRSVLTHA